MSNHHFFTIRTGTNHSNSSLVSPVISKQPFTAAFFVAANGSKVSEPVAIWKSKSPRCFKNIQDKTIPRMVYYAGIIRAFKFKYRKKLLKYVVSRIWPVQEHSEIIQHVNIAKAIHWLQVACRDASTEPIINCFQKCRFGQESVNNITNDNEIDVEFESSYLPLWRRWNHCWRFCCLWW